MRRRRRGKGVREVLDVVEKKTRNKRSVRCGRKEKRTRSKRSVICFRKEKRTRIKRRVRCGKSHRTRGKGSEGK